MALLPAERAADVLHAVVVAHAVDAPGACAALLSAAVSRLVAKEPQLLKDAAAELANALPGGPAAAMLAAMLDHLRRRSTLPLEPPRDWNRPNEIGCTCQYCRDLSRFLANPLQPEWALRAAQQHRTHVESEIKRARADVDMRTERKGSPHTLICRKNQASYERRVRQRKQDLADLADLAVLGRRPPVGSSGLRKIK